MNKDIVIVGAGPAGIFTALEDDPQRKRQEDRHLRKGRGHREQAVPEGQDEEMRKLQALLPHYDGLFRRGRIFGRKAVAVV